MNNNLIIVPISNEPTYGFKRTATMAALNIGAFPFMGESINLVCQVDYFEPTTDAPITIIPPKIVNLIADGTEYEYYMAMLDQEVVIQDLVVGKIQEADQQGRFN
jgi:hypothetical protein